MSLTVSFLQQADRQQWELLYEGYADFYQVPMTEQIKTTVWDWIFNPQQPFHCLIAKDEWGNGLGLMHVHAMMSPLRGCHVGFLNDLYVVPDARGRGVTDQLFKELELLAKAQQWPFVRWNTADNNYRGRGYYDKVSNKTQWLTYQLDL